MSAENEKREITISEETLKAYRRQIWRTFWFSCFLLAIFVGVLFLCAGILSINSLGR